MSEGHCHGNHLECSCAGMTVWRDQKNVLYSAKLPVACNLQNFCAAGAHSLRKVYDCARMLLKTIWLLYIITMSGTGLHRGSKFVIHIIVPSGYALIVN